jgi:hypothetical protein
MKGVGRLIVLTVGVLARVVAPACVPDAPSKLLWDPEVLRHPSVISALKKLEGTLNGYFKNTTRDGLTVAVVGIFFACYGLHGLTHSTSLPASSTPK